jgi:ribosomal protein S18
MKEITLRITSVIACGTIAALSAFAVASAAPEGTAAELKRLYGQDLQVLGEVQRIDLSKGVLVVAGQHVVISNETAFSEGQNSVAEPASAFRTIQRGDVLAISGPLDAPAVSISRLNAAYVPGSTTIFVKGKIAAIEKLTGVAKIDELGVDFTPAMSDAKFTMVDVGQVVEAIGTQPSLGGPLLANSISTAPSSITGTAKIAPSSITGTAKVSPDSITGTAKVSPDSITGTAQVAPSSITGTAKVSPDSITGTAKVAPSSITGTAKVSPDSITGTAKIAPSSITGTAKVSPDSITGTAKIAPSSITGTAKVSPDSITGTAKVAPSSITGTAKVAPSSITGTAKIAPSSITGK